MKKFAAIVLSLLVSFTLAVPAYANDKQVVVVGDAEYPSPGFIKFVENFASGLDAQFAKNEGQNLVPDHWVVFLSSVFSPTMVAQIAIVAIRAGGESERPILIAVLNEDSPPAVIRTAVKSAQRVLTVEVRKWQ